MVVARLAIVLLLACSVFATRILILPQNGTIVAPCVAPPPGTMCLHSLAVGLAIAESGDEVLTLGDNYTVFLNTTDPTRTAALVLYGSILFSTYGAENTSSGFPKNATIQFISPGIVPVNTTYLDYAIRIENNDTIIRNFVFTTDSGKGIVELLPGGMNPYYYYYYYYYYGYYTDTNGTILCNVTVNNCTFSGPVAEGYIVSNGNYTLCNISAHNNTFGADYVGYQVFINMTTGTLTNVRMDRNFWGRCKEPHVFLSPLSSLDAGVAFAPFYVDAGLTILAPVYAPASGRAYAHIAQAYAAGETDLVLRSTTHIHSPLDVDNRTLVIRGDIQSQYCCCPTLDVHTRLGFRVFGHRLQLINLTVVMHHVAAPFNSSLVLYRGFQNVPPPQDLSLMCDLVTLMSDFDPHTPVAQNNTAFRNTIRGVFVTPDTNITKYGAALIVTPDDVDSMGPLVQYSTFEGAFYGIIDVGQGTTLVDNYFEDGYRGVINTRGTAFMAHNNKLIVPVNGVGMELFQSSGTMMVQSNIFLLLGPTSQAFHGAGSVGLPAQNTIYNSSVIQPNVTAYWRKIALPPASNISLLVVMGSGNDTVDLAISSNSSTCVTQFRIIYIGQHVNNPINNGRKLITGLLSIRTTACMNDDVRTTMEFHKPAQSGFLAGPPNNGDNNPNTIYCNELQVLKGVVSGVAGGQVSWHMASVFNGPPLNAQANLNLRTCIFGALNAQRVQLQTTVNAYSDFGIGTGTYLTIVLCPGLLQNNTDEGIYTSIVDALHNVPHGGTITLNCSTLPIETPDCLDIDKQVAIVGTNRTVLRCANASQCCCLLHFSLGSSNSEVRDLILEGADGDVRRNNTCCYPAAIQGNLDATGRIENIYSRPVIENITIHHNAFLNNRHAIRLGGVRDAHVAFNHIDGGAAGVAGLILLDARPFRSLAYGMTNVSFSVFGNTFTRTLTGIATEDQWTEARTAECRAFSNQPLRCAVNNLQSAPWFVAGNTISVGTKGVSVTGVSALDSPLPFTIRSNTFKQPSGVFPTPQAALQAAPTLAMQCVRDYIARYTNVNITRDSLPVYAIFCDPSYGIVACNTNPYAARCTPFPPNTTGGAAPPPCPVSANCTQLCDDALLCNAGGTQPISCPDGTNAGTRALCLDFCAAVVSSYCQPVPPLNIFAFPRTLPPPAVPDVLRSIVVESQHVSVTQNTLYPGHHAVLHGSFIDWFSNIQRDATLYLRESDPLLLENCRAQISGVENNVVSNFMCEGNQTARIVNALQYVNTSLDYQSRGYNMAHLVRNQVPSQHSIVGLKDSRGVKLNYRSESTYDCSGNVIDPDVHQILLADGASLQNCTSGYEPDAGQESCIACAPGFYGTGGACARCVAPVNATDLFLPSNNRTACLNLTALFAPPPPAPVPPAPPVPPPPPPAPSIGIPWWGILLIAFGGVSVFSGAAFASWRLLAGNNPGGGTPGEPLTSMGSASSANSSSSDSESALMTQASGTRRRHKHKSSRPSTPPTGTAPAPALLYPYNILAGATTTTSASPYY